MNSFLLQTHSLFHNFYLYNSPQTNPTVAKLQKKPWVIQDICYAVPITADKLPRAAALAKRSTFHVCIDHPAALEVGWLGGWGLDGMAEDGSRNAIFVKDVGCFQISDIFLELDYLPRKLGSNWSNLSIDSFEFSSPAKSQEVGDGDWSTYFPQIGSWLDELA